MPNASGREVPVHQLRENAREWTPPCVIFLDTETKAREVDGGEVLELSLWVAQRVDRRNIRKTQPSEVWGNGSDAISLAGWVDRQAKGRDSVWLFAHNLNFDLATTRLPLVMADLGWEVKDFSVRSGAPFLRLRKGDRGLTVVDSWSWLPQALGEIGKAVDIEKPPLPTDWEADREWLARCVADVNILSKAILELMKWWDGAGLGNWTITGAGCGWNAMRHIPTVPRHVINPSPELVDHDRLAVRGGRKDAQRFGPVSGGPFVELDFVGAYPTVAKHLPLPWRRGWTFKEGELDEKWLKSDRWGVIAEVELQVDSPAYPVRWRGVAWYPIGRFRSVLAGPEIRSAYLAGHVCSVGAGETHGLGFTLQPWAQWVTGLVDGAQDDIPQVARMAGKAWGRSVIGKFAARGHSSEALGVATTPGWSIVDAYDHGAGRPGAVVQMAGKRWNVTYDGPADNAYPAVLAFVESHVRARLGAVAGLLGGSWVSCDTDGVIVDTRWLTPDGRVRPSQARHAPPDPLAASTALCRALRDAVGPLELRPKRMFASVDVLGPQHLVMADERRYSGLSKAATRVGPTEWKSRDWPKLKWQIQHGADGGYVRPDRAQTFSKPLVHRWVTTAGDCLPVEMTITSSGENTILPWSESRWAAAGHVLAPEQYQGLRGLY